MPSLILSNLKIIIPDSHFSGLRQIEKIVKVFQKMPNTQIAAEDMREK
jgi:hypothetical protein